MSPIKATTLEEQRRLHRRRMERERRERAAPAQISEEEEVASYLSICPMFTAGLMELNETNFIHLMLRTRKFMFDRWLNTRKAETAIAFNLREAWGYK